jgi:uncharacterized protein (TIGR02302 family)
LKADRIERFVALARASLAAERAMPRALPALGLAALFVAVALFGLFAFLPWPLHALILAAAISGIGLALYLGFADFALPSWEDGARRVEQDSGLLHRPLSESRDTLAAGEGDALARVLWRLHLAQRLSRNRHLRLSRPWADLKARDPKGLRYGVLALLAAALIFARGHWRDKFLAALGPNALAHATLDAWIDPPAYTGLAPLYLNPQMAKSLSVPEGSVLNLRVHGAGRRPGIAMSADGAPRRFEGGHGEYADTVRLAADGLVQIRAGGRTIGEWNLHVIADHPPAIAFRAPPQRTEHDAVKFSYAAKDDYGVVSVRAVLRPHGRPGKALTVDLPLADPSAKSLQQSSYADLTSNPYAGLEMDVTMEARDAAGHTGHSKAVRFRLPARVFTDPLARALVEQRSNLASNGFSGRGTVAKALDALSIAPNLFYAGRENVYLGVRGAYWAVKKARNDADLQEAQDLLWQIATSLERGGLLNAAQQLRQLQQLLTEALAQGAPQSVIDTLLERYKAAMQRYLQRMAQNPPAGAAAMPPNAKILSPKDLETLLKAIAELSQSGNRAQAAQMLGLLQSLLENLHMTGKSGTGVAGSPQDKALGKAMGELGALMGRQRRLMDKTFREKMGSGAGKDGAQSLAQEQAGIESDLQKLLQKLGKKHSGELDSAGKAMGQAQKNLRARDLNGASGAEKTALENLHKAADALARQLAGRQQGPGGDQDPLGRGAAAGSGGTIKIPQASDMARARTILKELRKRAGERGRSREELDYIDRLLKEF